VFLLADDDSTQVGVHGIPDSTGFTQGDGVYVATALEQVQAVPFPSQPFA
jgi:hypothetical protein